MDFKSIISGLQLQWESKSAAKKEMDGAKQLKKKVANIWITFCAGTLTSKLAT